MRGEGESVIDHLMFIGTKYNPVTAVPIPEFTRSAYLGGSGGKDAFLVNPGGPQV